MSTTLDLPTTTSPLPTTTHRVPWAEHEDLLRQWRKRPPTHPRNPRDRACDVRIEGRYSLFERLVNVARDRGWIDPPPPEYKWAVVTLYYQADDDPMDGFGSP